MPKFSLSFIILLCFINNTLKAQNNSIESIKDTLTEFNYITEFSDIYNNEEFNKLVFILNQDLFNYFDLENDYPSELSKLNYKKTKDYIEKKNQLLEKKRELKNSMYFFEAPLYCSEYNLSKKSFTLSISGDLNFLYNKSFIQYQNLLITRPAQLSFGYIDRKIGSDEFLYSFKLTNLEIAQKIEENRLNGNLRVAYVVRFIETKSKISVAYGFQFNDTYLVAKLVKLIIFLNDSGDILHVINYVPLQTNNNVTKRK